MTGHDTGAGELAADTPRTEAARAGWLRVLAHAPAAELAQHADAVLADYHFDWLRRPEQGLVMARARIGNTGDRFNLGDLTVTRCVARYTPHGGTAVAGVGMVLGLDAARAARVAQLDALLQCASEHALVMRTVVAPLAALVAQRQAQEQARAQASRVRFFELQPTTP